MKLGTEKQYYHADFSELSDVYDHDFPYLATGKAIPHGIFDVKANKGYIGIGNSHETAAFVADNLEWWRHEYG